MKASLKERIDVLMVKNGLTSSREKAKRLIMAGLVFVNQQRIEKPGTLIKHDDIIQVKGEEHPYVSRGGLNGKSAEKFLCACRRSHMVRY